MKNEDEKPKKEENKYLYYTQYYLITGVYYVVNVVNTMLSYSASYSSGVKEYLEEKVQLQKTIIDEIVADEIKKKYEFDEDDYVIIKMRKKVATTTTNPALVCDSGAPDPDINATVVAIVNNIINNAVDIVASRNSSSFSSCISCVESLHHHDDHDDGVPHHKSSIITSSYYAQFV